MERSLADLQCLRLLRRNFSELYHSTFESEQELVAAIRQVEFLFECLAQAGLDINDTKTQVLLQTGGMHAKQALKKYTECWKRSLNRIDRALLSETCFPSFEISWKFHVGKTSSARFMLGVLSFLFFFHVLMYRPCVACEI